MKGIPEGKSVPSQTYQGAVTEYK